MKRYDPESVGDVLRNLLEETSLQQRMDELKASDIWVKIVGPDLAALTSRPEVKDGIMKIGVANPALRHELMMNRSSLRDMINKKLGKSIISEIKFTA